MFDRMAPENTSSVPPLTPPADSTLTVPPLLIVGALARAPDDTISTPPELMTVPTYFAPETTDATAPLEINADTALPPGETVNAPPNKSVVLLTMPPARTISVPPESTVSPEFVTPDRTVDVTPLLMMFPMRCPFPGLNHRLAALPDSPPNALSASSLFIKCEFETMLRTQPWIATNVAILFGLYLQGGKPKACRACCGKIPPTHFASSLIHRNTILDCLFRPALDGAAKASFRNVIPTRLAPRRPRQASPRNESQTPLKAERAS
jgi:hypothetical protein